MRFRIIRQTRAKEDVADYYLSKNWKRKGTSEKQYTTKLPKVTTALAKVLAVSWPGRSVPTDAAGAQSGAPFHGGRTASWRPGPAQKARGRFLSPVRPGAAMSACRLLGLGELGALPAAQGWRGVRREGAAGCGKSFRGAENEKQSLLVDVCKINIGYMTPTGTAGPRSGCHLFFRWLRNDLNLRLGAGPLHDTVLAGEEGAGRQGKQQQHKKQR